MPSHAHHRGRAIRPLMTMVVLALLLMPTLASAEVRAWLDRDRIEEGETATLNIETDAPGRPDYAPLARDFRIEQRSSRQTYERGGARPGRRTLYAAALRPVRAGTLTVPALRVGSGQTAPLTLTVAPATTAPSRVGGPVFIEAHLDDPSPHVQQATGLTLRLHYSVQLLSGQLDQPSVDGIGLQRVGSDVQFTRELGGRRYQVVERRYLLVPERSGRIALPGATFRGRGVGGWFDEFFGDGQRSLRADGPALVLDVQPVPAGAPRPWLPLHGLQLRWLQTPDAARAGDAFTVELELVADGATAAQLEPPELVAGQGAQVFADPARHDETFDEGRPHVRMVRRFAVLPARGGTLRVEVPPIHWWDVAAGRAREATLPALDIEVAAAVGVDGAISPPDMAATDPSPWVRLPGVQGPIHRWALATVAFALLWLVTLGWALQWRQRALAGVGTTGPAPVDGSGAEQGARRRGAGLRHALDTGDLGEVSAALCALASPPAPDPDALAALLAPGPQREAIAGLQRARWGRDGERAAEARAAVRAAFARGPDWLAGDDAGDGLLPPHYPH
ncbi:MAG TPA: BatD family protein [Luteimonas sp.]